MGVDPFSLALIGTGLSVASTAAGTAMSIASAGAEADANSAVAKYRAAIARNNAAIARANKAAAERDAGRARTDARNVQLAAQEQVAQQDLDARGEIAATVADQTASGLTGTTHQQVRSSLRTLAARDRQNLRRSLDAQTSQARDRTRSFEQEAVDLENQARTFESGAQYETEMDRYGKRVARMQQIGAGIAGIGQIGSTLIGTASNPLISNWLKKSPRGHTTSIRGGRPFAYANG